jgi:hypothetical protein
VTMTASLPTSTEVNIEKSSNNTSFRWLQQDRLLFIRIVETHYKNIQFVWHIIVTELSNRTHKNFDSTQVDSKWKSLKQMYKKKKYDHNQRTGNSQKKWECYDAMHQILFNKPEINPPATCSSSSGLKVEQKEFESSFTKKRKATSYKVNQQHQEKMQRQDRFLDLFSELVQQFKEKK